MTDQVTKSITFLCAKRWEVNNSIKTSLLQPSCEIKAARKMPCHQSRRISSRSGEKRSRCRKLWPPHEPPNLFPSFKEFVMKFWQTHSSKLLRQNSSQTNAAAFCIYNGKHRGFFLKIRPEQKRRPEIPTR